MKGTCQVSENDPRMANTKTLSVNQLDFRDKENKSFESLEKRALDFKREIKIQCHQLSDRDPKGKWSNICIY